MRCHLRSQKGVNGFDRQNLKAKQWQELQVLSRCHNWLKQAENLQLFCPSGEDETHLADAITIR